MNAANNQSLDAFDQLEVRTKEFMFLDLEDDDILFLADLSYIGFFANILYYKIVGFLIRIILRLMLRFNFE